MHAFSIPLYFSRFMVDIYIVGGGTLLGLFIAYFESGLSMPSYIARLGNVFMVAGTIVFGFCAGLAVVGQFIYNPGVDEDECDPIAENDVEYEYINRYYDEFLEMTSNELSNEQLLKLKNSFLKETTPRGDVIMSYNMDAGSFWYWTDNKNVTYDMLNTVARKFTTEYNCVVLYSHNEPEAESETESETEPEAESDATAVDDIENNKSFSLYGTFKEALRRIFLSHFTSETNCQNDAYADADTCPDAYADAEADATEECVVEAPKSVFATFKQYNKNVKVNVSIKSDSPNTDITSNQQQANANAERANRFTYKGKLIDHVETNARDVVETDKANSVKAIDFATFKKMMQLENMNNSKIKTS